MKRFWLLCCMLLLAGCLLAACGQAEEGSTIAQETIVETYELALVTDTGTIDDKSFNQGAWEGLKGYGEDLGISYRYYQPESRTDEALLNGIKLAVSNGAKVVVCPGALFDNAIAEAQELYPDICFILIDAAPETVSANTYCIHYAEEQAGFLAGYAAVKEGMTSLGFMGGEEAITPVVRYGYGFVSGADYAARELDREITIRYTYTGTFDASDAVEQQAAAWYGDGVEVIFSCGGGICHSIIAAADAANKWVIGVDVDQSEDSVNVLTSATKDLRNSVYNALVMYYGGKFPGGREVTLDAAHGGVALPADLSRFQNFDKDDYADIMALLVADKIQVPTDLEADAADGLHLEKTTVELE